MRGYARADLVSTGGAAAPQQRLYFKPELQGHGALREIGGWGLGAGDWNSPAAETAGGTGGI